MPYYDREQYDEFPYVCDIYKIGFDPSLPPSEQVDVETILLQTKCNIQQSNASVNGGLINASFDIFFLFDYEKYKEENIDEENPDAEIPFPIQRGLLFRGTMQGMDVSGEIIGVVPSQLGKVAIQIKDLEV